MILLDIGSIKMGLALLSKFSPIVAKNLPKGSNLLQEMLGAFEPVVEAVGTAADASTSITNSATQVMTEVRSQIPNFELLSQHLENLKDHLYREDYEFLSSVFSEAQLGKRTLEQSELEKLKQYFLDLQTNPPESLDLPTETTTPNENTPGAAAKDTATEERIRKLEEENARLKASQGPKQIVVDENTSIKQDVDALANAALGILSDELTKEDSIPNALWSFGLKPEDAPEKSEELPQWLNKKIFGEKPGEDESFNACLGQYLRYLQGTAENPDPASFDLNDIQKKAFTAMKTSRWIAKWIPKNVRSFLGKFKLMSPPVVGFLKKIPVIGGFAELGVRLINEYVIGFIVFHGKNAGVLQAIASKYKKE